VLYGQSVYLAWTGNSAEWVAAIAACVGAAVTGAALIYAFRAWQASAETLDAQRRALEIEVARHADESNDRFVTAQRIAAGLVLEQSPRIERVEFEPPGGRPPRLVIRNESSEYFEDVVVELFLAGDDEAFERERRRVIRPGDDPWIVDLPDDLDEWIVTYRDLGRRRWEQRPNWGLPALVRGQLD
jgi:hypothetical protein